MRKDLLVGLVLTVAAVLAVFVSGWLDLELEPVALLGVALGAGRRPRTSTGRRSCVWPASSGFVVAWVGYLVRAAMLPDSTGGRAVAVGLVVVLAVAIAAFSLGRIPLWSTLLGAAALAGAYEHTYAAAPPEVASTSVSTATAVMFAVAIGFLATALMAPATQQPVERAHRAPREKDYESDSFDDLMMEKTK